MNINKRLPFYFLVIAMEKSSKPLVGRPPSISTCSKLEGKRFRLGLRFRFQYLNSELIERLLAYLLPCQVHYS